MLAPIETTALPVMVPETMTIFLALPATAAVRAAKVVTVVTVPPAPPVVPPLRVAYPTLAASEELARLFNWGAA